MYRCEGRCYSCGQYSGQKNGWMPLFWPILIDPAHSIWARIIDSMAFVADTFNSHGQSDQ